MVKNVKQWLAKQSCEVKVGVALSEFLRTYRNVPHSTTGRSPAQIIFGRALRTRLSFVLPCMSERVREQLQPQEELAVPRVFSQGACVWIRDFRPNAPCKWMPGTVLSSVGPLHYTVSTQGGFQRKAHIDHLLRRSESSDFMDVSQENEEVTEQLDPCISRKPLAPLQGKTWPAPQLEKNAPLQGKTWPAPQLEKDAARSQTETEIIHKAAQQEMTDVRTANTPGSDTVLSDPGQQPWTSIGKTAEQPSGLDRSETGAMGATQNSHMPPPRRHSTRPSRPP